MARSIKVYAHRERDGKVYLELPMSHPLSDKLEREEGTPDIIMWVEDFPWVTGNRKHEKLIRGGGVYLPMTAVEYQRLFHNPKNFNS